MPTTKTLIPGATTMTVKAKKFEQLIRDFNAAESDKKNRWTVSYKTAEEQARIILTAKHLPTGQEIHLVWDTGNNSEVYNYPESVYTRSKGDNPGEWTIRNVSEAGKIIKGEVYKGSKTGRTGGRRRSETAPDTTADTATTTTAKPKGTSPRKRAAKSSEPIDQTKLDLPFKLADDDETILKALSDKVVHYRRGAVMMNARVHPKNLTMKVSKSQATPGRRFIQFAGDEGFMTVYLDIIRKVTDPS